MKRICIMFMAFLMVAQSGFAFLYQIEILDKKAISKLSDEQIIDRYIDVLVEIEASSTFHQTSGFKPADYKKYKDILKYRFLLQQEIEERGLKAPGIAGAEHKTEDETLQSP